MNALAQQGSTADADFDPFAHGGFEQVVPTTEAQREIWLADRLNPQASLAYNESIELHLSGVLDSTALHRALDHVVARRDALRATFSADGMQLMIGQAAPVALQAVDLSLASDAMERLQAARTAAVETPFDLDNGPLLRASLFRLAETEHVLQLTAHHAVCDGWSWGVICRDLGLLYNEQRGVGPGPGDPFNFVDYASGADAAPSRQQDLAFWLGQFPEATLPVLELPLDRPRPPLRSFASRRIDSMLDAGLVDAVRKCGARSGVSLFGTLFAVFAAMVSRLAQQDDVVIGVPSAGQVAAGMPDMVGHCVNLLPVRVTLDPLGGMEQLVKSAGATLLDAFEHQSMTYGALLRQLPLARDPSRPSLVSVMFNLDSDPGVGHYLFNGLVSRLRSNPRHFENFELFLNAAPHDDGLELELQYNTTLFDEATVLRWLELYRTMLERFVAQPDLAIAAIAAPTAADATLMAAFNATTAAVEAGVRIETLIARQAAATPDAPAVIAAAERLTYQQLDRRANALAHALHMRGVGAGDLVGLSCARNASMLVALLGILKAGAGYVPLDPSFPRDRLDFMAQDARLSILVTDQDTAPGWTTDGLDKLFADDLPEREAPPAHHGDDGHVAYVIYTSGSTGRPKGVRVPHRSVVNLLHGLRDMPGICADHTTLAVTTLSFDIAVSEVIMPLTVGACIVVADKAQSMDGDLLRRLVECNDVRFIDATPSTWRLLLEAGWQGRADLLAVCTGEPLPPDLAQALLPRVGQLWNGYGPTETTVWSSFHHVTHDSAPVPIGRPVCNTSFHVLDAWLNPLPVGVTGELYIAGAGVTLGYLDREELTAERFIAPPGKPHSTERWYRTGDMGRWRSDGVLECLGRADHQVKVRGYRIELGEIEANLSRHPAIARALVVTREDTPGDVRIVAYVTPDGAMPDTGTLRGFLATFLPDYMLPQHYVALQEFPSLPNGKTDRNALPAPHGLAAAGGAEHEAPRNPLEAEVLAAMEKALSLPGVGIHDDFFGLGGHSLLAARLTAALSRHVGFKVPMGTLFQAPTAARLAEAIARMRDDGLASAQSAIPHHPERRLAPLTPAQERIRFVETLYPGRSVYNAPSGHRFTGPLDIATFARALQEIARRQPALRTAVSVDGETGAFVQQVHDEVAVNLEVVDLRHLPTGVRESQLGELMQAGADAPFDIHRAPLARFTLYRMGAEDHAFLFVPHHIVWDGWSFDVFQAELSTIYLAFLEGRDHGLPPVPVTPGDYAHWFAGWLAGDEFRQQLQRWKQRFAKAPPLATLPCDGVRRASMSGEGGTVWVQVAKPDAERLRAFALRQDMTLSMFCFATYVLLMAGHTSSHSVVVAMPVRGREHPELEQVMGFFNNVLPLTFQLDLEHSGVQFLRQVKASLLDVMNDQLAPFESLVQEPEFLGRRQGAAVYQTLFSFQDARDRPTLIGGMGHQQVHLRQRGVTDDLALWLLDKECGLEGPLGYNADIYSHATASAYRDRFIELLEKLATKPEVGLRELLRADGSASAVYLHALSARDASENIDCAVAETPSPRAAPLAPLRPEQAQLAMIWADFLGIDAADVHASDNFFDLGGDSLLAMRVQQQAESTLGFRVEARRYVFESLAQLADASLGQPMPAPEKRSLLSRWLPGRSRKSGL